MNMRNILRSPLLLVALLALAVFVTRGQSFNNPFSWVMDFLYRIPGLVIGITIHEFAHAKAANLLGDPTPKIQGRLSLNPVRHFDLFGLLALVFIGFGWGKPVMVSPYYFKNKRRDGFIVAVAGVATNFFAAFIFMGILVGLSSVGSNNLAMGISLPFWWVILLSVIQGVIWINLVLMVFNLLPVPPLDGFNMLTELFDLRKYGFWQTVYNWGFPILIVLILMGVTSRIMAPAANGLMEGLAEIWRGVAIATGLWA